MASGQSSKQRQKYKMSATRWFLNHESLADKIQDEQPKTNGIDAPVNTQEMDRGASGTT